MKDRLGQFLYRQRRRAVWPYLQGRLLDVGCGLNALAREYGNGVGVDVYDWGDVDFVVEDSSRLPFADAGFDTITCLAALNHIPNRVEVLAEMFRLLKPDGRLLVTMIPPGISAVWHKLRSPWDEDQKQRGIRAGEVYGITDRQMKRLIETAGFRLEKRVFFLCGFNRLYIARR